MNTPPNKQDPHPTTKRRFVVYNLALPDDDIILQVPYSSLDCSTKLVAEVRRTELRAILDRFKKNKVLVDDIVDRFKKSVEMDFSDDEPWFMWSPEHAHKVQALCDPTKKEKAAIIWAMLHNEIVHQLALEKLGPVYTAQNGTVVSIRY